MPLRDATCPKCEMQFIDMLVKTGDKSVCPICGSDELIIQMSYPANYTIRGDGSSTKPKGKGGSS